MSPLPPHPHCHPPSLSYPLPSSFTPGLSVFFSLSHFLLLSLPPCHCLLSLSLSLTIMSGIFSAPPLSYCSSSVEEQSYSWLLDNKKEYAGKITNFFECVDGLLLIHWTPSADPPWKKLKHSSRSVSTRGTLESIPLKRISIFLPSKLSLLFATFRLQVEWQTKQLFNSSEAAMHVTGGSSADTIAIVGRQLTVNGVHERRKYGHIQKKTEFP